MIERVSEYFPPELLNRLDSMLVFNKLSRESILQVVSLRLEDVQDRLKHRRITLDVDEPARNWLADQGYSDLYGARAIARIVRSKVLFPLAQKLLKGTIRYVIRCSYSQLSSPPNPGMEILLPFGSASRAMTSISKTIMKPIPPSRQPHHLPRSPNSARKPPILR